MDDVLRTVTATTLVPTCAERTWEELLRLLAQLWPGATDVLQSRPGCRLVHAVLQGSGPGAEPDAWLTWSLQPLGPHATRVVLSLDEIADSAPDPELDDVLVALLSRCVPHAPQPGPPYPR